MTPSATNSRKEMKDSMVRCVGCYNLVKAFFPTKVQGALFDEKWRCKVTGRVLEEYWLVEMKRECLKCRK